MGGGDRRPAIGLANIEWNTASDTTVEDSDDTYVPTMKERIKLKAGRRKEKRKRSCSGAMCSRKVHKEDDIQSWSKQRGPFSSGP